MDVTSPAFKRTVFPPSLPLELKIIHKTVNVEYVARRRQANNKLTEILYEAPESLVSGLILIFSTSLASITAYSVVFGWNFGVNFPGETDNFSKSALSMLF